MLLLIVQLGGYASDWNDQDGDGGEYSSSTSESNGKRPAPELDHESKKRRTELNASPLENMEPPDSKVLNLSNKKIRQLPDWIALRTGLKKLYLYNNQIEAFPVEIYEIVGLERLDLSDNHIKHVPDGIEKLSKLKSLYLYDNQIKVFPVKIYGIVGLEKLDLSGNYIKHIPDGIEKLINLQTLNICGLCYDDKTLAANDPTGKNKMAISTKIGKCKNLKCLILFYYTQLTFNKTTQVMVQSFSSKDIMKIKDKNIQENYCTLIDCAEWDAREIIEKIGKIDTQIDAISAVMSILPVPIYKEILEYFEF